MIDPEVKGCPIIRSVLELQGQAKVDAMKEIKERFNVYLDTIEEQLEEIRSQAQETDNFETLYDLWQKVWKLT